MNNELKQEKLAKRITEKSKPCARCGKVFYSPTRSVKHCSVSCGATRHEMIKCGGCEKEFRPRETTTKYCSKACSVKGKSEYRDCLQCSLTFKVHAVVIRRGRNAGKFCSQDCYTAFSKGENNPNWRGGDVFRTQYQWTKIADSIRQRDNNTCQHCGTEGGEIAHDVHHIIPYRISKSHDPSNLITLCVKCHRAETAKELKLFKNENRAI